MGTKKTHHGGKRALVSDQTRQEQQVNGIPNVPPVRLLHAVVCDQGWFLFLADLCATAWTVHNLCIHSQADEAFGGERGVVFPAQGPLQIKLL